MTEHHANQDTDVVTTPGGRRPALRALAAAGVALFAAAGTVVAAPQRRSRNVAAAKKKAKAGPAGPSGPAGPPGSQGPTGPAGPAFPVIRVLGGESASLGAAANSTVFSEAECPQPGELLSCGWQYGGKPDTLVNTVVDVGPAEATNAQTCTATLGRTATVGQDGGQIIAIALCRH
jgi:hypothetical protein